MKRACALVALVLLAAAPAPDPGLAALQTADARVARIAWRLQTAKLNLTACRKIERLPGFAVQALAQYDPAKRAGVGADLGIGPQPVAMAVVAGSSAEQAGLKSGDTILSVDGAATPTNLPPRASYAQVAETEALIAAALAKPPVYLKVSRAGHDLAIAFSGDRGCASRVQIVPGTGLDAQADGNYVQITDAVVAFARTDDELAVIIAHELAHNFLGHRAKLDSEGVSRGIFAGLGKNGAKLRQTEYEADALGVWLVDGAGYDIDAAVPFWTRYGAQTGYGILSDGTHPRWKARIERVAAVVNDIKVKRIAIGLLTQNAQQSSSHAQFPR